MIDEQTKQAASDPGTSPERLRLLYQEHRSLHLALAQNPSSPPDLLRAMVERVTTGPLLALVGANPNTPLQVLYHVWRCCPASFLENPALSLFQLETPQFWSSLPVETLTELIKLPNITIDALQEALRRNNELLLGLVARHPASTPEILSKALYQERGANPAIRVSIAKNPKTSLIVLEVLFGDPKGEVRDAVLQNPSVDPTLRSLGYEIPYTSWREEGREFVPLSHEKLYRLGRCGPEAKKLAALHPESPAPLLLVLALGWAHPHCEAFSQDAALWEKLKMCGKFTHPERALLIAKRPALSAALLEALAGCSSFAARAQLASREELSESLLISLSKDRDENVRAAAAKNPKLPASLLSTLSKDVSCVVRIASIQERLDEASMRTLIKDKRPEVLEALTQSSATPPSLLAELLVGDVTPRAQANAAQNPNTPKEALERLQRVKGPTPTEEDLIAYATQSRYTRSLVLNHHQTPIHLVERFVSSHLVDERESAAISPLLSEDQMCRLAIDNEPSVRIRLAGNPKTPARILRELASTQDLPTCRELVKNPNTPHDLLRFFASKEQLTHYKYYIGQNTSLPEDVFEALLQESYYSLRIDLIQNPSTPRKILLGLLNSAPTYSDEIPQIAAHPNAPLEAIIKAGDALPQNVFTNAEVQQLPSRDNTFLESLPAPSLLALSRRKDAPPALLRWISSHKNEDIHVALARSFQTPKDVLQRLKKSKNTKVLEALKHRLPRP